MAGVRWPGIASHRPTPETARSENSDTPPDVKRGGKRQAFSRSSLSPPIAPESVREWSMVMRGQAGNPMIWP